jgi:hypothetical protein
MWGLRQRAPKSGAVLRLGPERALAIIRASFLNHRTALVLNSTDRLQRSIRSEQPYAPKVCGLNGQALVLA